MVPKILESQFFDLRNREFESIVFIELLIRSDDLVCFHGQNYGSAIEYLLSKLIRLDACHFLQPCNRFVVLLSGGGTR